jgi:hypothetical protein
MTKEDYLNTKEIQLFIDWILPKIRNYKLLFFNERSN